MFEFVTMIPLTFNLVEMVNFGRDFTLNNLFCYLTVAVVPKSTEKQKQNKEHFMLEFCVAYA